MNPFLCFDGMEAVMNTILLEKMKTLGMFSLDGVRKLFLATHLVIIHTTALLTLRSRGTFRCDPAGKIFAGNPNGFGELGLHLLISWGPVVWL